MFVVCIVQLVLSGVSVETNRTVGIVESVEYVKYVEYAF